MRSFRDATGRTWQVVLGRESWGSHVALFVPANAQEPVREATLHAVAWADAMAEIEAMDQNALQQLLDRSRIKE